MLPPQGHRPICRPRCARLSAQRWDGFHRKRSRMRPEGHACLGFTECDQKAPDLVAWLVGGVTNHRTRIAQWQGLEWQNPGSRKPGGSQRALLAWGIKGCRGVSKGPADAGPGLPRARGRQMRPPVPTSSLSVQTSFSRDRNSAAFRVNHQLRPALPLRNVRRRMNPRSVFFRTLPQARCLRRGR